MMTLDEIKTKTKEYGYSNETLSELSGVPLAMLRKIMEEGAAISYENRKALSSVFEKDNMDRFAYYRYARPSYVRERPAVYGIPRRPVVENINDYERQGTYTMEDYLALPEEQRVELIDGVFYDMGAPTGTHQLIGGFVHAQFLSYIRAKKGDCVPFIAPADVQLNCDNRTMVQPDVFVVCDRSKLNQKRLFGAPDYVLEVLSPSTKNKDMLIKSAKYQDAGVREYWMVDPMTRRIFVYQFENETVLQMYTFEDRVPVGIYNGDLVIDFHEISEFLVSVYGKEEAGEA